MVKLFRCDWCGELIDPVKGDEMHRLYVEVSSDDDKGSKAKDHLCDSCRPKSAGALLDWIEYNKDDE